MKIFQCGLIMVAALTTAVAFGQADRNNVKADSPRAIEAKLYRSYVEARNKGDFTEAKASLDRMILKRPENFGNYLEAAKVCFELQDFPGAAKYFKLFKERFPVKDQPVEGLAQNFVIETLIQSAKAHREPDWRLFSKTFGPEISLVETLRQECQSAIAENRTKTAAEIIAELQGLGLSAGELNGMRGSLKRRIEGANAT